MAYPPGTKVVCVDATPIPIRCGPGVTSLDFTFPNGFLEEGKVYCVEHATQNPDDSWGLFLVGLPILLHGRQANWHHSRFRSVQRNQNRLRKESSNNAPQSAQSVFACFSEADEKCLLHAKPLLSPIS